MSHMLRVDGPGWAPILITTRKVDTYNHFDIMCFFDCVTQFNSCKGKEVVGSILACSQLTAYTLFLPCK